MEQNFVITGANGFLGRNLVNSLEKDGHSMACISHKNTGHIQNAKNAKIIKADISKSLDKLKSQLKGHSCLYHLAAVPNIYECLKNTKA